ncbi:MAG: phospholipase D-like domain-containing protein [Helicobacteraceae bacterium]|jgi:superfamily II DNA/RNA helicase|nr:phospholipase D-like domain-containing protein [Helicobacteraceae bacterium]
MSSKFFTNQPSNTLFDKFKGIARDMNDFHSFHAVVGFFRSSGYFKLRKELENVEKIQILVGINVDNIFRKHNRAMLMLGKEEEAKKMHDDDFIKGVQKSDYSKEIEDDILQFCEDLNTRKAEMKIHGSKNLHAKFYLCLPQKHSEHSDGWVIMGSSNISESGLGISKEHRYELNVALKDFDDVAFCKAEFDKLWEEGIPITASDIESAKQKTYIGVNPTPYELYIKVLINSFGDRVEDNFTIELPKGVRDIKYQKDAVIQGYQMLCEHNGFFLADVVGLGKTMVAVMIAKRFIEANGRNSAILVIYPPALEKNWKETFKLFGIYSKAQFVSNGSLSKIIDNTDNHKDKKEFDLIIVDEAHSFRSDSTNRYDELQRICKSRRNDEDSTKEAQKKVMLLSATPLNNRPDDLLNQILLFQNARQSTIDGVNNLREFFAPLIQEYKQIMKNRESLTNTSRIDEIYDQIRNKVLDKITVRRTRQNIWNNDFYRKDLEDQNLKFPKILPPKDLTYQLNPSLNKLFYDTLKVLTNDLNYARYRAVEFLSDEHRRKHQNPANIGENLAGIYRVHMVKRLESSFYAFKKSLDTFLTITNGMIKMFDESKIIIAPSLNLKKMQTDEWEFDRIVEEAEKKGFKENIYSPDDFVPKGEKELLQLLKADKEQLENLKAKWDKITEDPKLDLFIKTLESEIFNKKQNPNGKLVIFSESVDTVNYLEEALKKRLDRDDILKVWSGNRDKRNEDIQRSFDANYAEQSDEYNIIITSDVLSEGVNLHRANVIVNYDSPWNATRLMQRIGRVNRIGSIAGEIHNYMFYPSAEGDAQIRLYKNALIKLQGFHSALGEDAQIYSKEEIVKEFQLFNPNIKDKIDKELELLREVRELYNADRKLYNKIKAMPMRIRAARNANKSASSETTIAFISSPRKIEYYEIRGENVKSIDFLDAAAILKASPSEPSAPFEKASAFHYGQVNRALEKFNAESIAQQDGDSINKLAKDKNIIEALGFFRIYKRVSRDTDIKSRCEALCVYIKKGIYAQLTKAVRALSRKYKNDEQTLREKQYEIDLQITNLYDKYYTVANDETNIDNTEPDVVISETFV